MHFNQNNCKIFGNFKTEQGYNKVRLYTTFVDNNIKQCVNLTEIKQGYSLVDFLHRFISRAFPTTTIGFEISRLRANKTLSFLEYYEIIRLPVNYEVNLMKNKVILHLKNNENETQIRSNKGQITSNETNIKPVQQETVNSLSMYNKQEYMKHLDKVYSKITVSGNELLTLTNETLYDTAGSIENWADLSQATAPKSADSCKAECITEARPSQDRTKQPDYQGRRSWRALRIAD